MSVARTGLLRLWPAGVILLAMAGGMAGGMPRAAAQDEAAPPSLYNAPGMGRSGHAVPLTGLPGRRATEDRMDGRMNDASGDRTNDRTGGGAGEGRADVPVAPSARDAAMAPPDRARRMRPPPLPLLEDERPARPSLAEQIFSQPDTPRIHHSVITPAAPFENPVKRPSVPSAPVAPQVPQAGNEKTPAAAGRPTGGLTVDRLLSLSRGRAEGTSGTETPRRRDGAAAARHEARNGRDADTRDAAGTAVPREEPDPAGPYSRRPEPPRRLYDVR